jgi:hypothetical protein
VAVPDETVTEPTKCHNGSPAGDVHDVGDVAFGP